MLGVIVQILDASKFADEGAAARLQLTMAPFSFAKLSGDLVDIVGTKANRQGVELVARRPSHHPAPPKIPRAGRSRDPSTGPSSVSHYSLCRNLHRYTFR